MEEQTPKRREMLPANMVFGDLGKFVKTRQIKQVTSNFIFLPSTTEFHPEGLFSKEIFGPIGSTTRLIQHGYINTKVKVLHPDVYDKLVSLNRLYGLIMSGQVQAVYDNKVNEFFKLSFIRELKPHHSVGTGYSFFIRHLPKLEYRQTASRARQDKITFLEKYKDRLLTNILLVLPAGLRDMQVDNGKQQIEEINKFYNKMLLYTQALPDVGNLDSEIWDNIRYGIQKLYIEINDYIFHILDGKSGFINKKVARRSVAMGTRNVLTGTKVVSKSSKGFRQSVNDTVMPLFQASKAFLPLTIHHLFTTFMYPIMNQDSNIIYAIEPSNLDFVQVTLTDTDKKNYFTRKGLEDRIENYRIKELRHQPFTLFLKNKKIYYFFLVYDTGDQIFIFRNLNEFKLYYKEAFNKDIDMTCVRPMTNIEVMYIATSFAVKEKHVQTTRFPVAGAESTFATNIIIISTEPSREVDIVDVFSGTRTSRRFHMYPIRNESSVDGVRIHPIHLGHIQGDYDGDTTTNFGIWTKDANEQIRLNQQKKRSLLSPTGVLKYGLEKDVTDITFYNLSLTNRDKKY